MIDLKVLNADECEIFCKKYSVIKYIICQCPFGKCLAATLCEKLCHLSFVNRSGRENLDDLKKEWPQVRTFVKDEALSPVVDRIFAGRSEKIEILVRGTAFEEKIWKALLLIPRGKVESYSGLCEKAGFDKKAARAVGNAVSNNPVAYVIPCHRVVNKSGGVGKYKRGSEIKEKILRFEGVDVDNKNPVP